MDKELTAVERLADKLGDWRTWAALLVAWIAYYTWKHSKDFVVLMLELVKTRSVFERLKALEEQHAQCKHDIEEEREERLRDTATYNEAIGKLNAENADLRRRISGLSKAFIKARHGVIDVPDPAR